MHRDPQRVLRVSYLAWRNVRSNKARLLLLVSITTAGLLIFMFMFGLSNASGSQLEDAIDEDLGIEGSYRITIPNQLSIATSDLSATSTAALDPTPDALIVFGRYSAATTTCPGIGPERDGLIVVYTVRSPDRLVTRAETPDPRTATSDACINGFVQPTESRSATGAIVTALLEAESPPLVIDNSASPSIEALHGRPDELVIVARFVDQTIRTTDLRNTITRELEPIAARSGLSPNWIDEVSVLRTDGGASIRTAEDGVRLAYQLIAWGVLTLGALAILVAQLMTTQSRTWLFGLARTWGARRSDLALLASAEVAFLVLLSLAATLGLAAILGPSLSAWSTTTFDTEIALADPSVLPTVIVGAVLLAAIGAGYPAYKASKVDPLEALET